VTATRIGNLSKPATINYSTADGSATNMNDYVGSSGTLQFAAGETFKQFQIGIVDDANVEATKTFTVVLNLPGGGVFQGSPSSTTISILDDDRPLLLTDDATGRAIALSSISMLGEPFTPGGMHNLAGDQRTRILLFASGIDDNSLSLFSAKAEGPNNQVFGIGSPK
jgi:hypothetical protein